MTDRAELLGRIVNFIDVQPRKSETLKVIRNLAEQAIAAHDAAPDAQAQKARLADEMATTMRYAEPRFKPDIQYQRGWLARYDAIADSEAGK